MWLLCQKVGVLAQFPVNITPVLSKVFEHLLVKHVNAYAENDVLILLKHIFPNTYQGIINALYPATRWILAVYTF